jgi:hypothetical protein
MIDQLLSILNQPVPYMGTTTNDWEFLLVRLGLGLFFVAAWWFLCFFGRNGWDGGRMALRALHHKGRGIPLRMILLNNWKVHGTAEGEVGPVDLREPR